MDDGVAVRVVGARLEPTIGELGLANKTELLSKIVAGFVGGVCDGEWEANISKPRIGDVGHGPCYAYPPHDQGGEKCSRRADEQERILQHVDNVIDV